MAELLGEARGIADASFVAEALAALAEDPRLDVATAGRAYTDATGALNRVDRAFRKAEAGAEVARRLARWLPDNPEAEPHREKAFASLANLAQSLQGKDLAALAVAIAKVAPAHRAAMLRLVLHHGADPIEDAKAVLAAGPGPGVVESIVDAPPAAQARLLAYHRAHGGELPLQASLASAVALAPLERREAFRAIIAAAPVTDLNAIRDGLPVEAGERGRLLCALAARADRLGDSTLAATWFDEAAGQAATLPAGKEHDAVLRNVEAGRARLGGASEKSQAAPKVHAGLASPAAVSATVPSPPATTSPAVFGQRHVMALVDAYEGQLGDVHLRALGRAAPLCWSFGLDLGLIGFPVEDISALIAKAGKSTGIGEGGGYLEKLAAAGRIQLLPPAPAPLAGFLVATTPKPDPAKATDFPGAHAKGKQIRKPCLIVLVGLGPKGLPGEWMKAAPVHLELTGDNVSLETATAMGIIADRLHQLPLPI